MSNQANTEISENPIVTFDEFETTDYETWKEAAVAMLKGASFEKKLFTKTYEGITLEPIYTSEHTKDNTRQEEFPGLQDYVRGTKVSGYIKRPWEVAQIADAALPQDANKIIINELQKGSTAVHLSGDMYITNLKDIQNALNDVELKWAPIHMFTGESSVSALGLIAARAKANGAEDDIKEYSGCVGADPIAIMASKGRVDINKSLDEMALVMKWAKDNMPNMRTVLIQGNSVYHNGGANAIQEVAYSLAEAVYYIDAMQERGLTIDEIAPQIRFCFSIGANYFMEIAKLRAVRALWAQIIEAYGGSAESQKIDVFARTSYFTETTFDPYVNVLRATTQTFSGVVGGVNTLQVAPFDEAIRPSDEQSRRIARNIQLMFQNEFDMIQPVDPAGGSWYIENLTEQLMEKTWEKFQSVCANGGIINELRSGDAQKDIGTVLQSRLNNLDVRKDSAVGTNMYANMLETPLESAAKSAEEIENAWEASQKDYKSSIDQVKLQTSLDAVSAEALMPSVIEAFANGATTEQIRQKLVVSSQLDLCADPIEVHRWTEKFETLRNRTKEYKVKTGNNVKIFLATMGSVAQYKARADFSTGFVQIAEFEVIKGDGFETVEDAAKAAKQSGADAVVICSTDKTYPEIVPPLAKLIKTQIPDTLLYLAGAPAAEMVDEYVSSGVDDFIHVRANCYEILSGIQEKKGIN